MFLTLLDCITAACSCERPVPVRLRTTELGTLIPSGLEAHVSADIRVVYNENFPGGRTGSASYSTTLRPDISLWIKDKCYVFDAKYRLRSLMLPVDDQDVTALERDERDASTFRRGDLYKMHTYRDALRAVESAWVVYPGATFLFFGVQEGVRTSVEDIPRPIGVGAIPYRPHESRDNAQIRRLIETLISSSMS